MNNFRLDQFLFNVSKPHCLWVRGWQDAGGASEIGRPVKGGRKILDASRRGGGEKNFGLPPKGGQKFTDLINFFQCF